MTDFEDNSVVIPATPEEQSEADRRKTAEVAITVVQAVKDGIIEGFTLSAIRGADLGDTPITRQNADMALDMIRLKYEADLPDLFKDLPPSNEEL